MLFYPKTILLLHLGWTSQSYFFFYSFLRQLKWVISMPKNHTRPPGGRSWEHGKISRVHPVEPKQVKNLTWLGNLATLGTWIFQCMVVVSSLWKELHSSPTHYHMCRSHHHRWRPYLHPSSPYPSNSSVFKKALPYDLLYLLHVPPSVIQGKVIPFNPYGL